jgi:nucleotide-binding universal stress UspA family protein
MYKKVLAPLDGSELSECTLEHLKAVVAGCQVPEVILLRVTEPIPSAYWETGEDLVRKGEEMASKNAQEYLSQVAGRLKADGIDARPIVIHGKAADVILDYAKENGVDLIVLSTHGRSGVSRWVLGSVADRVVRHSIAPVLTITPMGCRVG